MGINELLQEKHITKYRLSALSGVPHATLSELCSGKTNIGRCSVETIYKLAKTLGVSMETLVEDVFAEQTRKKSFEKNPMNMVCRNISNRILTLSKKV